MRHKKKGRKLHRKKDQRKLLMKSLAENLVLKGKIKTTKAKAKELKSFIEKKITKAKEGNLAAYKYLRKYFSVEVSRKIVKEVSPRFKERKGGYTRITKLGERTKDSAEMVIIEIVK
jgi:large subunit ribosomal protein L17